MLVRYSIVELLMVFEVSAQREHTIIVNDMASCLWQYILPLIVNDMASCLCQYIYKLCIHIACSQACSIKFISSTQINNLVSQVTHFFTFVWAVG